MKMKSVDLYSGIGGWTLGLNLAGIENYKSYEWNNDSVITSNKNFGKNEGVIDVRSLTKKDFLSMKKAGVNVVVGSPPCTQFSYANRGGSGDIDDGLVDLKKFFECINVIKPKFWAMENVPRVANVIKKEILQGGQLESFQSLIDEDFIKIIDMSEFGLPQKRKRCIVSNINFDTLFSYKELLNEKTLGEVTESLRKKEISDINFNISLNKNEVYDNIYEDNLTSEEVFINRDRKQNHTVYNNMSFPEKLSKPARTITSTCTKVSRESLIIQNGKNYRRLTLRERASLQGFPINFNFFSNSYSGKLKMIGNALPPVFSYYLANVMLDRKGKDLVPINKKSFSPEIKEPPPKTVTETSRNKYQSNRSFEFAITELRFKSGLRFQLSNRRNLKYEFQFFFGTPKDIKEIPIDDALISKMDRFIKISNLRKPLNNLKKIKIDSSALQKVWINEEDGFGPLELLDEVNGASKIVSNHISQEEFNNPNLINEISSTIEEIFGDQIDSKIRRLQKEILVGFLVASSIKIN